MSDDLNYDMDGLFDDVDVDVPDDFDADDVEALGDDEMEDFGDGAASDFGVAEAAAVGGFVGAAAGGIQIRNGRGRQQFFGQQRGQRNAAQAMSIFPPRDGAGGNEYAVNPEAFEHVLLPAVLDAAKKLQEMRAAGKTPHKWAWVLKFVDEGNPNRGERGPIGFLNIVPVGKIKEADSAQVAPSAVANTMSNAMAILGASPAATPSAGVYRVALPSTTTRTVEAAVEPGPPVAATKKLFEMG